MAVEEPAVLVLDDRGAVVHASFQGAEAAASVLLGESFSELVTPDVWARLAPELDLARRERAVRPLGDAVLQLPGGRSKGARWSVDARAPLRDGAVLLVGRWLPADPSAPSGERVEATAALDGSSLAVGLRPVLDVADGVLRGIDAVVRRRDSVRGLVPALADVAEGSDRAGATEVARLALTDACSRLAGWQAMGRLAHLQLVMALRGDQFEPGNLVGLVRRVLDESGLPAVSLCISLPEAVLADADQRQLRDLDRVAGTGVHLAVHDLGVGRSSLAVLHRLPLDVVRLPRQIVQDPDPRQPALVAGLTALAHRLGMRVVAEGVETDEQLDVLRSAGCDAAHGHLFGVSLPFEDFAAAWDTT